MRFFVLIFILLALAETAKAQVIEDKKRIQMPDTVSHHYDADFDEWLRNEPLKPELHDSTALRPMPPRIDHVPPQKLYPSPHKVDIVIMTPKLRTDMELAYQSHFLEEQRKSQVGGAMTIGLPILPLLAYAINKIFPKHKSKKERQREKLKEVLDNY